MRDVIRKLLALLQPDERRRALRLFIMMIIMAILQVIGIALVLPFLALVVNPDMLASHPEFRHFYRFFDFSNHTEFLIITGIAVFLSLLLSNGFNAFGTWRQLKFVSRVNHTLSARMLAQYLHQPYVFYLMRNIPSLSATVLGSVNGVIVSALMPCLTFFTQALVVLFILAMLLFISPGLSLLAAAVFGLSYAIIYLMAKRKLTEVSKLRVTTQRKRYKVVSEVFGAIRDVMVLNKERVFVNDYHDAARQFAEANATANTITSLPKHALEVLVFGGVVLAVLFFLITKHDVHDVVPMLGLYAYSGYRIMPALQQMFASITSMRSSRDYVDNVYKDLIKTASEPTDLSNEGAEQALAFKRSLRFDDVTFSYPATQHPALHNINLTVECGSITAIVGSTGVGKSTLLDLMLALLLPTGGHIYIDDIALTPKTAHAWRLNVGYVPQVTYLCNDTIAHNIAFGIPAAEIDMQAVKRAAKIAELDAFILNELPQGYDTIIGDQGIRLSGGQRQRISIARALYRNPKVLFLDEATSALDSVTEKKIVNAIHALNKTVVIITHRLNSVREADQIILIDAGTVIDQGDYQTLIEANPLFKAMVQTPANEPAIPSSSPPRT